MEIRNFTITKRDGTKDRFSLDKIMNAVIKAFESVGQNVDLASIYQILNHLDLKDDIKVEDIQNQVEEALMKEGYYQVATVMQPMQQQVQNMTQTQMWSTKILQHSSVSCQSRTSFV